MTEPKLPTFVLTLDLPIQPEWVSNATVGLLENGYSPWFSHFDLQASSLPTDEINVKRLRRDWYGRPEAFNSHLVLEAHYDDPDGDEGEFEGKKTITWDDILLGLRRMAEHSPRHFSDLVREDDDAYTHDALWQYIIFGELIYG